MNEALLYLQEILANKRATYTLESFGLPTPIEEANAGEAKLIQQELDYDCESLEIEWKRRYAMFNKEQRQIFDEFRETYDGDEHGIFFIDAPGGCGNAKLF